MERQISPDDEYKFHDRPENQQPSRHLAGDALLELIEELRPRLVGARARCRQIDGGADLRGFEVVGIEGLGPTARQQVLDVSAQPPAWSLRPALADLGGQPQRPMLQHLGVGDADAELVGRVAKGPALQEPQLQYPAVLLGKSVEDRGDPARCGADHLIGGGGRRDVVDCGDLFLHCRAPVSGQPVRAVARR